MNFDQCFTRLIGHEGGYVNHPNDPGGETKYGISKRSYPNLSIADLTEYDAMVIYQRDFWNACKCDQLPPDVRFDVFDAAVNSGVSQSIKWLQRALCVSDDGVIGKVTLSACNNIPGYVLKAKFNGHRLEFMTNLKTWPDFGRGWAKRIAQNLING